MSYYAGMEEAQRARLIERRRLAQLRRERAAASAAFRGVAPLLCERGVRFSKLVPERCRAALGTLASGPGRDERLLWGPTADGTCRGWETEAERNALLRRALAGCTGAETKVAVVWHPFRAGLRIAAAALAVHAGPVLEAGAGDTTWIVAADGGPWLIEVAWWDWEICWAARMPAA